MSMTPRERRKAANRFRRAKERAEKERAERKRETSKRKYEKMVEAGVDPERAAFAVDYVPEGTTRTVAIQSTEGVGITARVGGARGETRIQETFGKDTDIGREFAIPTDEKGRTPLQQRVEFNRFKTRFRQAAPEVSQRVISDLQESARRLETQRRVGQSQAVVEPYPTGLRREAREFVSVIRAPIDEVQTSLVDPNAGAGATSAGFIRAVQPILETTLGVRLLGAGIRGARALRASGVAQRLANIRAATFGRVPAAVTVPTLTTGALFAPDIASRIAIRDREVLQTPEFQEAFGSAVEARRARVGLVGGFLEESLGGIGSLYSDIRTGGATRRAFQESIRDLPEEQRELVQREFRARQIGSAVGILGGQVPGEIVGRRFYDALGFIRRPSFRAGVATLPAGALEGALIYGVGQRAQRERIEPTGALVSAGIGAGFASLASAAVVGSLSSPFRARRIRGRGIQTLLNVADPAEIFGDIGADLLGPAAGRAARRGGRARAPSVDIVSGRVFTQDGTPSTPTRGRPIVPVETRVRTQVVPRPDVPVIPRPDVPVIPRPDVPVVPRPDVPVVPRPDITVVPQVVPQVIPRILSRTNIVNIPARSQITVPTFTDFPILPTGGLLGGATGGRRGRRGRRDVFNLPSLTRAIQEGFAPSSVTRLRGRRFTGIEIR